MFVLSGLCVFGCKAQTALDLWNRVQKNRFGTCNRFGFGGLLYGIYGLYYFPLKGLLTMIIQPLFLIGVSLHWRNVNRKIWIRLQSMEANSVQICHKMIH